MLNLLPVVTSLAILAGPNASEATIVNQPGNAPAPNAERFDPAAAIGEVRRIVRENYVLPERRPAIDAILAEGLRTGRYDVREPALFAERVSSDLWRVAHDHHLNFRYDPAAVAAATSRTPDAVQDLSLMEREVRRRNHGIRELKVLPGNVRYLDLASFEWIGDESEAALNAAMAFLKGGDAVIIDLRGNGGGNGRAVHQVISHFLEAGRPLITFYRGSEASPAMRSLPRLSTMVGKPLYVLTSGGTGSAAEEFVGHVAGYKLGEVIGAKTSGGAFMNEIYPIGGRFELSVSVARPVLAATEKDWEGTGIAPTIAAPVESALETAHLVAVRRLAAAADPSRRAALEGVAEGLSAIAKPGTPAGPPQAYVGSYADRQVIVEDGKLWYRIGERPRRLMVPLGGNRFTVADDPLLRLDFSMTNGRAAALDLGPAGGPVQGRYERTH